MDDAEDWELLEAWRRDDRAAGQALLGRYMPVLQGFFRRKVGSAEDVADLVSETMLVCARARDRVRDSGAFRSFLFSSATNVLRRHFEKKTKRDRERGDFEQVVATPNDRRSMISLVSLREEGRLVARALRRLPLDQQIVLELTHVEGLSGGEIAEHLGIPRQTVYARLRRGTEKLRTIVTELADSPELARSTMTSLETWATRIRAQVDA